MLIPIASADASITNRSVSESPSTLKSMLAPASLNTTADPAPPVICKSPVELEMIELVPSCVNDKSSLAPIVKLPVRSMNSGHSVTLTR